MVSEDRWFTLNEAQYYLDRNVLCTVLAREKPHPQKLKVKIIKKNHILARIHMALHAGSSTMLKYLSGNIRSAYLEHNLHPSELSLKK